MNKIAEVARIIADRASGKDRAFLVALVGPPASGKSTLAQNLADLLDDAVVLPMDGFHLDNAVLKARGLASRKGAPETFDADGFVALIKRLKEGEDVVAPGFDRHLDLARAGAIVVPAGHGIVLVEGNYLLLDEAPWHDAHGLWDLSIMLDVDREVLKERLLRRWLDHGLSQDEASQKTEDNDLPNATRVLEGSKPADMVI